MFQGVGAHELAADAEQRLEVLAVGGPGDGHGVTAAVANGAAHPVGEVDAVIAERGAGRSSPVACPASRGLDRHHGSLWLRQQDVSGRPGFPYKHIGIIGVVGSLHGPGGNIWVTCAASRPRASCRSALRGPRREMVAAATCYVDRSILW